MRKTEKRGSGPLMIVIMVMISVLLCMTFALLAFNNRSTRQLIYSCLSDKAGRISNSWSRRRRCFTDPEGHADP